MTCKRCKKRDAALGVTRCEECQGVERRYQQNLRRLCVEAYGGKCECCGTAKLVFLTIDHINERGAAHRKEVGGSGRNFYSWLKRNKFPRGFRVLCFNCNFANYWLPSCPCYDEEGGPEWL